MPQNGQALLTVDEKPDLPVLGVVGGQDMQALSEFPLISAIRLPYQDRSDRIHTIQAVQKIAHLPGAPYELALQFWDSEDTRFDSGAEFLQRNRICVDVIHGLIWKL